MNKITTLALFIGLAVLAAPLSAFAQGIDVAPDSCDYGNVKVGFSPSVVVTMTCAEPTPLTIYSVTIVDDATGSFAITSTAPPPEALLFEGESIDVTVEFAPSGLGPHSASVRIDSDAEPPDDTLFIPLEGVGVEGLRYFERLFHN